MSDPAQGSLAPIYRILACFSPVFPVGAFSYSHGLETAAESGQVRDRASLQGWIIAVLSYGAGRIDGDILREAHRAASVGDITALTAINRRGVARLARRLRLTLEAISQGETFLATRRAAWPDQFLDTWAAMVEADNERACHAAAAGAATARAGVPVG